MNPDRKIFIVLGLAAVLFVTALSSFLLLHNLGEHSISLRSDEVVYVRVTQSVVNDGAWWHLKHGPAPFFEKPPLKFWLSAVVVKLFGESNFTFRVLDASLGIAVVMLTALLSIKMFGIRLAALIPAILILSCLEAITGEHGFRRATIDALLTALTVSMMLVSWRLQIKSQSGANCRLEFIGLGALAGLAVLAKSAGGVSPFICTIVALSVNWPKQKWSDLLRGFLLSLFVAAVIALPYFAYHLLTSSRAFKIMLGIELFERVWAGFEQHNRSQPFFYLHYLLRKSGLVPSSFLYLTLLWLPFVWRKDSAIRFLSVWFLLPVLCYSCAASRAPWYLLPALPACAILTGRALEVALHFIAETIRQRRARSKFVVSLLAALLILRGGGELYRKFNSIFKTVDRQQLRIPLDLAAERILSEETARVVVLDKAIPTRVAPVKGRFNVEGVYLEMLRTKRIPFDDLHSAINSGLRVYLIKSLQDERPLGIETDKIMDLPAFNVRKTDAVLLLNKK